MTAISSAVRLGTRGSRLALAQAEAVSRLLEPLVGTVQVTTIKTSGDKGDRDKLGAFVGEIQDAVRDGRVDLGLHCLKDLPTLPVEGLMLGAYIEREDPSDAILCRGDWTRLPKNAVIGTGSLRRSAQLSALRPDLRFKPLLGNVDTRLRKLLDGEYDAIVLAVAGLKRLGLLDAWAESPYSAVEVHRFGPGEMLPAPGQAVLVLECRSSELTEALAPLNHPNTKAAAVAERSFLHAFGGGCSVPVAALGRVSDGVVELEGLVAQPNGSKVLRGTAEGNEAEETGAKLARQMIDQGALDLFTRVTAGAGGSQH